ncbi:MAG: putative ABC transporter ATP-binding protein [Chloroflexi bacterium ADurb.Bin222]|nr:MAG: putative ABC transporter ATP-binding protein [Chloroflexi bacterium ADurb.Bin222]
MQADPAAAAALGAGLGFDLTKLPPGMDLFTLLANLPAAQRAQMSTSINERFSALGESMINQMAVRAVSAEYAALGMDTGDLQMDFILRSGGAMLLFSLLSISCTIAVGYLSARIAAGVGRDVRKRVFEKVTFFSNAAFDQFSTASLITRSTNDITQVQMVIVMMLRMVIYAPIIGVGGVIHALDKSTSMWWIIALAVTVLLGLILTVFAIALPRFKAIQTLVDRLNLVMREALSGMMVIRAFNMQDHEAARFDKANRNLTDTMLFISRVMVVMMPVMMLIMNGLALLIIWIGSHQVAESAMQVGDMMAFMQYSMQIVFAFLMLSMMFIILPRASVSAGRIADVLDVESDLRDPAAPAAFPEPFAGTVEFRNVCFRYPGAEKDVLHEINFVAKPGETTAFIGSTGSGKSTIVNLIPRFHDVTCGEILVGGVDIRSVTQRDLRDKIGYIPQKGLLFSGTIESNLRYGAAEASAADLEAAATTAQAAEFIFSNPEGLQAEIAQGGANVSGGQKQRLAIARALVKRAPIYIFDDSFSALDFKTDAALRRALKETTAASTIFVVTQRVATIQHAEQIIVLDEGCVVGKGTHRELLESCEVYRDIALSQLGQEEIA